MAGNGLDGASESGGSHEDLGHAERSAGVREDDFKPHLKAEAARIWELYRLGVFRELYFRKDRPGAVLILECADVEEAGHVLNTLPLVKEALIDFDIIPLKPYPGFARLFAEYA